MKYSNFDIIERFAYFLPYGYLTPHALELSIPDDSSASLILYDPAIAMDERITLINNAHRRRTEALYAMECAGYIQKVKRKVSSKNADEITIYRLTQSGFFVLTGTYDEKLEEKRIKKVGGNPIRIRNRASYQYANQQEKDDLIWLNNLAESPFLSSSNMDDYITSRELSILASEMAVARKVRITPSTKAYELYRNSRLANVNALFRANNYLTLIDLLPMECVIPVIDIHDPANQQVLSIEAFTNSVLQKWYDAHWFSMRFTDPVEYKDAAHITDWYSSPTFYPLSIIPGFSSFEKEDDSNFSNIGSNRYHHTAIGLAAGRRANYLVYHTHPCSVDWRPSLQKEMKQTMDRALKHIYEKNKHPHLDKSNEYALMICPTVHQFKALFKNAKDRMGKKKGLARKVARPFDALCIIPLNHAGCIQIKWLMESNPIIMEDKLARSLVDVDQRFQRTHDPLFPLSIHKTSVFIAATMNFQQLFDAMELYEQGKDFYVICLPEQVSYIRSIMPNVRFL